MAGFNVAASRNGLPLHIATGQAPVYTQKPITIQNANPLPGSSMAIRRQVAGDTVAPTAVLPVNQNTIPGQTAVRGAIQGVGNIKSISVGAPRPTGTVPGASAVTGASTTGAGGASPSGTGSAGSGGTSSGTGSAGSGSAGRIKPSPQIRL